MSGSQNPSSQQPNARRSLAAQRPSRSLVPDFWAGSDQSSTPSAPTRDLPTDSRYASNASRNAPNDARHQSSPTPSDMRNAPTDMRSPQSTNPQNTSTPLRNTVSDVRSQSIDPRNAPGSPRVVPNDVRPQPVDTRNVSTSGRSAANDARYQPPPGSIDTRSATNDARPQPTDSRNVSTPPRNAANDARYQPQPTPGDMRHTPNDSRQPPPPNIGDTRNTVAGQRNAQNASISFSISDQFSLDTAKSYPMTDFIRSLLAISSNRVRLLKRDALTSYRLLSRARAIYIGINELISVVELENNDDWTNFDKVTAAIRPLEQFLFDFHEVTESGSKAWLPTEDRIEALTTADSEWQRYRKQLRGLNEGLFRTTPNDPLRAILPPTDDDNGRTAKRDDMTLLTALCNGIHGFERLPRVQAQRLEPVKSRAIKIVSKITLQLTDQSMEHSIRSTMLVYGFMSVLKAEKETHGRIAYLSSKSVWTSASDLLLAVYDHLKDTDDRKKETDLTNKITAFIKLLSTIPDSVDLPKTYFTLRKSAKDVRRPFFARTLVLLKQTRDLAGYFREDGNNIAENLTPLNAAIDSVKDALNAAALAAPSITAFKQGSLEAQKGDAAFVTASSKLESCFEAYELKYTGEAMTIAEQEDKDGIKEMGSRPSDLNKSPPAKNVSIKLKKRSSSGWSETPYTMDETTSLNAILWKETSGNSTSLHEWRIEQGTGTGESNREAVGLETEVRQLKESGGMRVVYFVN